MTIEVDFDEQDRDYDGAWKEALQTFFAVNLECYFPLTFADDAAHSRSGDAVQSVVNAIELSICWCRWCGGCLSWSDVGCLTIP